MIIKTTGQTVCKGVRYTGGEESTRLLWNVGKVQTIGQW